MFTGIVEAVGTVEAARRTRKRMRLRVRAPFRVEAGESVAVNGVCLTAVAAGAPEFDAVPETLARTNLESLRHGSRVNLERSLRMGERLGGHLVQGHVDGVGIVANVARRRGAVTLAVRVPVELSARIVSKGSIAVDGVSLTVVDAEPDRFTVALVPFTLAHTTLGSLRRGACVNIETDFLARYVDRKPGRITRDFLARAGFPTK